ncbi:ABC transporter ATP-binding protein [Clostridioides difficile]
MNKLLEVKDLEVNFKTDYGEVKAIRKVSLDLYSGEVLAIVGESGCGKSMLCRSILKLLPKNGYIRSGKVNLLGNDITKLKEKDMSKIRGKDISMIFQDPMTSLNPTISVGKQIAEVIKIHNKISKNQAKKRAVELMDLVGIEDAENRYNQYPYHFSGGMRQRIVIAISLACRPKVLIADEPTTALDVRVQRQILDLLKSIQRNTNISIIFITHDFGVVSEIADRIAVMYAGKIIEIGKKEEIFLDAVHPYTIGLMSCLPTLNKNKEYLETIEGMPPNLLNPPKGDAFAIRNKNPLVIDFLEEPPMFKVSDSHYAATWLLHPKASKVREEIRINKEQVN